MSTSWQHATGTVFLFLPVGFSTLAWSLLTCVDAHVACQVCILTPCDIGRSDIACLAKSISIRDGKSLPSEVFPYNIRVSCGFFHCPWLWTTSLLQLNTFFCLSIRLMKIG